MVVTVYVNHERGEALSVRQFEEMVHNRVESIMSNFNERSEYLNDYLEADGYDYADCFEFSESRREDILRAFRVWLYEDVKYHLLDNHFDEYEIEI